MKKLFLPFLLLVSVLIIAALPQKYRMLQITTEQETPILPGVPFNYDLFANPFPFHFFEDSTFFQSLYDPQDTLTFLASVNDIQTLGRVLFYDKRLSENRTVSCASCHHQKVAFADTTALSLGFDGQLGERNSIGLTNAFVPSFRHFFWDAATDTMSTQIKLALESEVEMGLHLDTLISRLEDTDFYPGLFNNAFGSTNINVDRAVVAIRSFVLSMTSWNTKYDQGRVMTPNRLDPFPNFTQQENLGKDVFMGLVGNANCSACHQGEFFNTTGPMSNGLDQFPHDPGYGAIGGTLFEGTFRAPTLRNIELTAPYMHDGRFETLEEVVAHYANGVQDHSNLSPALIDPTTGKPKKLNLTPSETTALVAFLKTLTDPVFIRDIKWANPFDPAVDADTHPQFFTLPVEPDLRPLQLKTFPNPATDQVEIQLPIFQRGMMLTAFDVSGRPVFQQQMETDSYLWQVSQLPRGIYVLHAKGGGQQFAGRVMLK